MLRQFNVITKLNKQLQDIKSQLEMARAEMERYTQRSEELELYCRLFDGGKLLETFNIKVKWGASSRWSLSVYFSMSDSDQMIIGKTHPEHPSLGFHWTILTNVFKVKCRKINGKLYRFKAVMTCSYGKCHNGGGSG